MKTFSLSETTAQKRLTIILYAYISTILLIFFFFRRIESPMLWQGATVKQYIHEFANLVPFATLRKAVRTNNGSVLSTLLVHFVAGIFPGFSLTLLKPDFFACRANRIKLIYKVLLGMITFYFARVLFKCGSCDIDDIMLDIFGIVCGMAIGLLYLKANNTRNQPTTERTEQGC